MDFVIEHRNLKEPLPQWEQVKLPRTWRKIVRKGWTFDETRGGWVWAKFKARTGDYDYSNNREWFNELPTSVENLAVALKVAHLGLDACPDNELAAVLSSQTDDYPASYSSENWVEWSLTFTRDWWDLNGFSSEQIVRVYCADRTVFEATPPATTRRLL